MKKRTSSSSSRRTKQPRRANTSHESVSIEPSVDVISLMRELSKAARETIEAKDQLIKILMARQPAGAN